MEAFVFFSLLLFFGYYIVFAFFSSYHSDIHMLEWCVLCDGASIGFLVFLVLFPGFWGRDFLMLQMFCSSTMRVLL